MWSNPLLLTIIINNYNIFRLTIYIFIFKEEYKITMKEVVTIFNKDKKKNGHIKAIIKNIK